MGAAVRFGDASVLEWVDGDTLSVSNVGAIPAASST